MQEMTSLPDYGKISFPLMKPVKLYNLCPDASAESVDLLSKFLIFESKNRISASMVQPF
jgi:hypothetical protein